MANKRKTTTTTPKSRRASKRTGERKPLAEISENQDESLVSESKTKAKVVATSKVDMIKKKDKQNSKKNKKQRSIDDKTDDDVIPGDQSQNQDIFILIKKTKEKCKAIIDNKTGVMSFIPKDSSEYIPFDGRKHRVLSSSIICTDAIDDNHQNDDANKKQKNTTQESKPNDFEIESGHINKESKKRPRRCKRGQPQSYAEDDLSTCIEQDDERIEKKDCENMDARSETSPSFSSFSKSRYAAGLEVEGGDWRNFGAIDY